MRAGEAVELIQGMLPIAQGRGYVAL